MTDALIVLVFLVFAGLIVVGAQEGDEAEKRPVGTFRAACMADGSCKPGLVCQRGRIVVDPPYLCLPAEMTRTGQ